jgi:hypothetical protein
MSLLISGDLRLSKTQIRRSNASQQSLVSLSEAATSLATSATQQTATRLMR